MKQNFFRSFLILFLLSSSSLSAQLLFEGQYTRAFLDDTNLGEMTNPNIFEFGVGWAGHGGWVPHGAITIGYITFDDKMDLGQHSKLKYQSLTVGGKLGFRPLANVWTSRFQPLIQLGGRTTFSFMVTNPETNEKEQLFSNGITKQYDPAKITFLSGSLGFEFYMGQRTALVMLGNYDYIMIEKEKMNNYSASIGLRHYY